MYRTYLLLIFCALITACNSSKDHINGYTIMGSINGISEGLAYLQKPSADGLVTVDSTEIADGQYQFTGTMEMPQVYYIKINNSNYYITFFLENSSIRIESHKDSLYHSRITGSASQMELDQFHSEIRPFKIKLKELYRSYYKAELAKDENKMFQIDQEYERVHKQQIQHMKSYAMTHSSSVVASYITARYLSNELDYASLDSLYQSFKSDLDNDRYLKKLEERLEVLENIAVGKPAVDIIQNDTSHSPVRLSSLKGRYVLLEFWASWCTSCKNENKRLKEIYTRYHANGFEIYAVSLDNDYTQWVEAVQHLDLPWINVSDLKGWQSETRKLYGVIKTPHNLLIDKDGVIVAKDLYGDELRAFLDTI